MNIHKINQFPRRFCLTVILRTNTCKYICFCTVRQWVMIVFNWIILRWGFLIWELIFSYYGFFVLILVVFFFLCVVSSFTTFLPNFTSGLLQVILPRPRIGMLSLVAVFPVITAFHSCCLSHHVFDQVNLWLAWIGFETVPGEHCQKIAVSNPTQAGLMFTWSKTWCDRQQLWKAVITGNTVTRLIIPIRGRGKITWRRPEVKFGRNVVKEETTQKKQKNYQDEDKRSAINKNWFSVSHRICNILVV